ncbi:MAG: HPr(Ser) kinase/phosphatase [Clostridiaceae bacterium]|nr:HPr(Ser) kinase/phosphatase [Clostridiaceae bacterium]
MRSLATKYSVMMHELIKEFKFDVVYGPDGFLERTISSASVNRPGLQLTGFYEGFDNNRIQVLGKMEQFYMSHFNEYEQEKKFDELFSKGIPLLILSADSETLPQCIESAKKFNVPVVRSGDHASEILAAMIASLNVHLGPRLTMHGVFVEVYGEGILLLGDSGVGKSETAIELLKRGHRLVADDAVDIKRVSAKSLVGSAPELIRYFMELRGIGVVDVRRLFGMGAVKPTEKVDLIINLEKWEEGKNYDRMGIDEKYTTILDIKVPSLDVPVKPGRNLAVIIEVAAMNNRHKKMGHNAGKELSEKIYSSMVTNQQN